MGSLALLAARVLAAVLPGRWLWGLDLARDLPPLLGIVGLAVPLALHAPPLARALARRVPREGPGAIALAAASALALGAFAWTHPDRALYTGDASLRHGAFATFEHPEQLAQQSMRGDLMLHYAFPRWVGEHTRWTPEQAGRAEGALLAVIAAVAGWRLARTQQVRGGLAFAVAAIAGCTGALALDNGYAKASVEVACLTGLAAAGMARAVRDGGGLGAVGTCVALGLLLHRSAVALLPAWGVCVVLATRAGAWRRPASLAGLLAPPIALAIAGPRIVTIASSFDVRHHLMPSGIAGTLAAALAPAHLADALNTICLLVPLTPLLPMLLLLPPRPRVREAVAFGALTLPPLALLVALRTQQGLPRDWDVFAFAGTAIAAVLASRAAAVLSPLPRAHWLALPLAASSLVPALQWAALQADADRLWSRAESILAGPPERDASERAAGLGTIGMIRYARGQFEPALRLLQRSAEAAPNPRTWVEMGMAETVLGRPADALAHYQHAASLNPNLITAWRGMAAAASALGDRPAMEDAVRALERLEPEGSTLHDARAWLEANPPKPAR